MFVTNHALSGVLIGQALPDRPVAAFLAGVGSHLLLDACPHWGCDTKVPGGAEHFHAIAQRDGLAGLATIALAVRVVDNQSRSATIAAMAGAVLLDMDKPFVHFFRFNPIPRVVQSVHSWVQNEAPERLPHEVAYGLSLAVADAAAIELRRRSLRLAGLLTHLG